jgi:cytochrome bd-type quinol oxidase subunit 2
MVLPHVRLRESQICKSETVRNRKEEIWMILRATFRLQKRARTLRKYAVILALILVVVVGALRLIGSNTNVAFSAAASSLQ